MRGRHQKGYVYRKSRWWFVRYYDRVPQPDGTLRRVQVAKKVAPVDEYPRKTDVKHLVEESLLPLNSGQYTPLGTTQITEFVEGVYLPYVQDEHKPSTYRGYLDAWRRHLKARLAGIRIRDFRTVDGQNLLREVAASAPLSRTTLAHLKSILSGIFKHAKRMGYLNGVNPMQDVSLPKGSEPEDTYAYSLHEVEKMLAVLPLESATMVGVAAFTGLRRGEIRGLHWEDYDSSENTLTVRRSVWRGQSTDPKTRKSRSSVPVILPLRTLLEAFRVASGSPTEGLIFRSMAGNSVDLSDRAKRVIRPVLSSAGIVWHGWHAFRRGLATNLHGLGVGDKTIQAILRHGNLSTTMNSYVKPVQADTKEAMSRLEAVCTKNAPTSLPFSAPAGERVM